MADISIEVDGKTYTVRLAGETGEPRYRVIDADGYGVDTVWGDPDPWLARMEAEAVALQHKIDRIRAAEVALEIRGLDVYAPTTTGETP